MDGGQVRITDNQKSYKNQLPASVAKLGYEETKETCDQMHADVLLCSQLQNEEQGSTLEQKVNEPIRKRKQKMLCNRDAYSLHSIKVMMMTLL